MPETIEGADRVTEGGRNYVVLSVAALAVGTNVALDRRHAGLPIAYIQRVINNGVNPMTIKFRVLGQANYADSDSFSIPVGATDIEKRILALPPTPIPATHVSVIGTPPDTATVEVVTRE